MRRWLSRLGLALGAFSFALLGAELAVRVLRPAGPLLGPVVVPDDARRALFERDASLMMRLRPGAEVTLYEWEHATTVRINGHGLRGPEITATAPGPRVLALGDSFTLALQVEEEHTWTAQLAAGLTERLGEPVEVLNAGCEDYGTKQQVLLLERLLADLEVDAVVVGFFVGNDVRDNLRRVENRSERARIQPAQLREGDQRAFDGERPRGGWSHLLYWNRHFRGVRDVAHAPVMHTKLGEDLQFYVEPAVLDQLGAGTRDALDALGALCASRSLPCLVATIPPDFVAEPDRAPARFEAAGLDVEDADLDAIATAVAEWAPATVPVVDLAPALREAEGPERYLRHDGHWSPEGHRVAADALVEPVARLLEGAR